MRVTSAWACAVAVAVVALVAQPVSAATLDPVASAARMLRKSDVTVVIGLGRPLSRSAYSVERPAPVLCNQASQHLVQGRPAASNAAVALGGRDQAGLMQIVYDYGSREAAADAFRVLVRRAGQCDQVNSILGGQVQTLTTGAAAVAFRGVGGLWTREVDARSGRKGSVTLDSYSLNLLVGETIQQFSLAFIDAGRTADVQRSAVDTLALDLARRWQS